MSGPALLRSLSCIHARVLRAPNVVLLVALTLAHGCNIGRAVGGGCVKRLSACFGQCVNLGSDSENCGVCGNTCAEGTECRAGACVPNRHSSVQFVGGLATGPDAMSPETPGDVSDGLSDDDEYEAPSSEDSHDEPRDLAQVLCPMDGGYTDSGVVLQRDAESVQEPCSAVSP